MINGFDFDIQDHYCQCPKLRNILHSLPQFTGSHFCTSALPHFHILGTRSKMHDTKMGGQCCSVYINIHNI